MSTSLQQTTIVNETPFLDYHIQDGFLYKLDKLCVSTIDDHLVLMHEAHAPSYGGHFDTFKPTENIQCHLFCPYL